MCSASIYFYVCMSELLNQRVTLVHSTLVSSWPLNSSPSPRSSNRPYQHEYRQPPPHNPPYCMPLHHTHLDMEAPTIVHEGKFNILSWFLHAQKLAQWSPALLWAILKPLLGGYQPTGLGVSAVVVINPDLAAFR